MTACVSPQIRLDHVIGGRDRSASYVWNLTSTTVIESANDLTTKTTALRADVRIERRSTGKAMTLEVSIRPRRYSEDGIATTTLRPIELTYTLDSSMTAVGSSAATDPQQPSASLVPVLGHEFAALGRKPVDIGDIWPSDLRLTGVEELDLKGTSTLEGFRVAHRRRSAVVSTRRSGTLSTTQAIGKASADLNGTLEQTIESQLDLGSGSLAASDTRSRARLQVSVAGSKQALVTVTQRSRLRLISYSSV